MTNDARIERAKREHSEPARNAPMLPIEERTGAWKEVTDLDEGDVVLTLPEELSPESYEDLKTWMELILRKAKRRAGVTD